MLCKPAVVSVTQASEFGTVYSLQHLGEISAVCRRHGLRMHMDGARFANALAHLECQPAEMSWRAGIDVLSFGATKNGAMAAEAVLVFDPALAEGLRARLKRGGLMFSKHRFLGIQFNAYLANGLWLDLARRMRGQQSWRMDLRALGPKRWTAAYVQPSRRPKDGRYGENTNRMKHYYQFQVTMKP